MVDPGAGQIVDEGGCRDFSPAQVVINATLIFSQV